MYYLDSSRFSQSYYIDAWLAFSKRDSSFYTHGHIEVAAIIESLVNLLHEGLNFTDTPNPIIPKAANFNVSGLQGWGAHVLQHRKLRHNPPKKKVHAKVYNYKDLRSSPILNALGGGIEKIYSCEECKFSKTTVESFVSLSFKPLSTYEVDYIRSKFAEKKYSEGLVYRDQTSIKSGLISIFNRKVNKRVPLLTIRDFLCHLNYTVGSQLYPATHSATSAGSAAR